MKVLLALFGLGLILGPPAFAATLVDSDFNVNDEGWRVGTLFSANATIVPFYLKDIPTDNGWIETSGLTPFLAFAAPLSHSMCPWSRQ